MQLLSNFENGLKTMNYESKHNFIIIIFKQQEIWQKGEAGMRDKNVSWNNSLPDIINMKGTLT